MSIKKPEVAKRIKGLREERFGQNEAKCAEFLGLKYNTYRDYESGRSGKIDVLEIISLKFGVALDWLILGRGPKHLAQADSLHEEITPYGQREPMDPFWNEFGRNFEALMPASDRELTRQHVFMVVRPHMKSVDDLWKRYKGIRSQMDKKKSG